MTNREYMISLLQNDSFVDDGGTTVDENEE